MVTFLSGGTGTPKLVDGATETFPSDELTVVANTGDDVELGGLYVSPDIDTLLFLGRDVLDRESWWGIEDETFRTHEELADIADEADLSEGPQYLDEELQTAGRDIARWRRFSGVAEFMKIGDRDRALHLTRTSLLDQGDRLSEVIEKLASGFDAPYDLLPMSDDPVATIVHTDDGPMHFQEFWVGHGGEPEIEDVEFRGAESAEPAPGVLNALAEPVVIGPSNPITSIGPILSVPGIEDALERTPVVAVSPFLGEEAFSGPAAKLMEAVGVSPSTAGLEEVYPFVDAYVLDEGDETALDRPTVRTDIRIDSRTDAERVSAAVDEAFTLAE